MVIMILNYDEVFITVRTNSTNNIHALGTPLTVETYSCNSKDENILGVCFLSKENEE